MRRLGNLLIVSNRYPHDYDAISSSFVKNQVDCIKECFDNIFVIALVPIVPKFLTKFSFMNPRWMRDAYATDYEYDNVSVYFAKYPTLPFETFREKKGDFAFRAAYKTIKNNNVEFDLIHAHFTYPSGYVCAKLKTDYNKPFVLTVHEDREWFLKEINDQNAIYTWSSSDKIIRVNKSYINEFKKIGICEYKILYLPNGFSSGLFRPEKANVARKELGLPIDKKILVNIANLEKYKGQKYLINAMKYVLTTRDDVVLYIVGQGSLERNLQSLIDKHDLQNNVILAGGNKPREEIPHWINACDLFVLPSLSESFGVVQIEAMACGKPVVATYNGGSEEIIINDELGILVDPKDPEGLAQAIGQALVTEWDAKYVETYAQQFTWKKIADKILNIYKEVLK